MTTANDTAVAGTIQEKHARLQAIIRDLGSVVVAFSGGVDSALLFAVAHRVLGAERCLGVTAVSESLAPEEFEDARNLAAQIGARWETIDTNELDDPGYRENSPDRCYYCKRELFTHLGALAGERGYAAVLDGFNADDTGDWRPGRRAGRELSVHSPLMEAGFSKPDIRELSRMYGLPTADKPSFACLASRLPYGTAVTAERLAQVARGETVLRSVGFRTFRVRYHGPVARLELGADELAHMADSSMAARIVAAFRPIGFETVTVDLAGFRTGSQNEKSAGATSDGGLLGISPERTVLRKLGFARADARVDEKMVRLRVPPEEMARAWERRGEIVEKFRAMGYTYVALDLPSAPDGERIAVP